MDAVTRHAMARDYLVTLENYARTPVAARQDHLRAVIAFAKTRRHDALEDGATSIHDILWNAAATIETVATELYLVETNQTTSASKQYIISSVSKFIDENLTPEEIVAMKKQL